MPSLPRGSHRVALTRPRCLPDTGALEDAAATDEAALEEYLESGALAVDTLRRLVAARALFPVFFGAALRDDGVRELLDGMCALLTERSWPDELAARVFRVSRGARGERLAWVKVTGGTLRAKDQLTGVDRRGNPWAEKINEVRLYQGERFETVTEVPAGRICAVTGLSHVVPGSALGAEPEGVRPLLAPVLSYQVIPEPGADVSALVRALRELADEDPMLGVTWQEQLQEAHVQPMGEVQQDVIAELLRERYGFAVTFGPGGILYAGDYVRQDIEAGGITVEFYYGRKHQAVMEAAGAADAVRAVVDYCTEHYGALSFGTGDTLKLIQSRVAGGGYASDGASLLDEADFTTANLGNTGKGAVPGEVFIHELVHQWWGLGNMFDVADETSPWSSEGLTVYTTYRIVKELYGEDYAQKHYVDQWQQEVDDYFLNFYVRHPEYLEKAEAMLMVPDYLQFRLTGKKAQEYTEATTGQLIDPNTKDWDYELIDMLGFPRRIFQEVHKPGTVLGNLKPEIAAEVGFDLEVMQIGSHDTASAVLAVPANDDDFMYIRSGTWSLMGIERKTPDCSPKSCELNFTNEGGYEGRFRYIKNIMGLWMIQSVRHEVNDKYSFAEICAMAEEAKDFPSRVNANDECFLSPENMTEEVKDYCRRTGQKVPETMGEIATVIYTSLAECYAKTAKELEEITGRTYSRIHVVGGGSNAGYLNELTAKATGKEVHAGPGEATAIGNITAQMLKAGDFKSVEEARTTIHESFGIKIYK